MCYAGGLGRLRATNSAATASQALPPRPVALRSQVIRHRLGGLGTPARAKARTEHPGVNSDCVIDVDPPHHRMASILMGHHVMG
jgi:hypothetical protein